MARIITKYGASAQSGHYYLYPTPVEPAIGIEPMTSCLPRKCYYRLSYAGLIETMTGAGFEPAAFGMSGQRSTLLSYPANFATAMVRLELTTSGFGHRRSHFH
jgi:hypothetical protein